MATGTLILPIGAATLPDGTAGNAAPAILRIQGTEANPKKHYLGAYFDAGTDEHLWWSFPMPSNYASAPVVKLLWVSTATSNSVVWVARLAAVTPADTDTPAEHVAAAANSTTTATNTTEAGRLNSTSITVTNDDSVAAGDLAFVLVHRDADNGSDNMAADAALLTVAFEYTTT